jgi:hypothetical protein
MFAWSIGRVLAAALVYVISGSVLAQQASPLTYRRGETVAVIQVGTTKDAVPLLRRIEYGIVSPTEYEGVDDPMGACLQKVGVYATRDGMTKWGKELRNGMDQILARTVMPSIYADPESLEQNSDYAKGFRTSKATLELHLNETAISETSELLGLVSKKLNDELEQAGCKKVKGRVFLTLIQRVCPGLDGPDCRTFRTGVPPLTYVAKNTYADRFDLLLRWAYAYRAKAEADPVKAAYAKGLLKPNQYVLVSNVEVAPPVQGTQITDSYQAENAPATDDQVQEHVERMVEHLRSTRPPKTNPEQFQRIPAHVLLMLDIPQQIYVRLADGFNYAEGLPQTLTNKPERVLLAITDRMAQARVSECVLNRAVPLFDANGAPNIAGLKACTGYSFPDVKSVLACLPSAGKAERCAPKLDAALKDTALVETISMMQLGTYVRDGVSLATSSMVGRLSKVKYSELSQRAKDCTGDQKAFAQCVLNQQFKDNKEGLESLQKIQACANSSTGAALADCISKSGFQKAQDRLKQVKGCVSGTKEGLADCVAAGVLDNETQRQLSCIRGATDATARAACIAKGLPGAESIAKFEACEKGAQEQRLQCLGSIPGMPKQVAAAAAACQSPGSLAGGAACAKALGINIPPGVDVVAGCISKSSTAEMAACAAEGRIGGDGGKVLSCATQSNFDAAGTGACVAGTMLGFNQDLMMAATCVAQTGGEPISAGTCTFGKLAMRELEFCKSARFGEGKCFGKNNTLVKLFNIGANSVVADALNVQLEMYKGVAAFIENPSKATSEFVQNAGRELTAVRDNVVREMQTAHDNVRRELSSVFGKGVHIKVSCCKIKW